MAEKEKAATARAGGDGAIKIAAVGDLHVKEDAQGSCRDLFGEVSREADILVLAGDLTNLGKPREAEVLAEDLRACAIPVVAVLGNHDYESGAVDDVSAILRQAGVHLLDGQTTEISEIGFVGVKGFVGGFGSRMLGSFGEPAIKAMVAERQRVDAAGERDAAGPHQPHSGRPALCSDTRDSRRRAFGDFSVSGLVAPGGDDRSVPGQRGGAWPCASRCL
jgi:hypothetical protein